VSGGPVGSRDAPGLGSVPARDAPALSRAQADALGAVFPGRVVEGLAALGGGLSGATRLSFTVDGAGFVLRQGDPARAPHEVACLRIASEVGVAPRLHYADARTGVSITERVEGARFGGDALSEPDGPQRIAGALRRLHEGPSFPRGADLIEILGDLDRAHAAAAAGERLPADLRATVTDLAARTAPHAHAAPCHKDLNPNNILCTRDRVCFVDWETAGAGDPFLDVAQVGVFALPAPEAREAFLAAYLRRAPSDQERARALVARVLALSFYAAAFAVVRAHARVPAPRGEPAVLVELLRAMATSRERTDPGVVAAALWRQATSEIATPDFAAARDLVTPREGTSFS
jgi:hypothetical protein